MLTLTQLSNLAANENIDMWAGLQLPADSPMNRDVLINTIIEHCGLNIPVYSDPFVMSNAIALWSAKNQYTFEHVGKIYEASYSPIENYDRYEDMSTDHSRSLKDDTKSSGKKNELNTVNNSVKNTSVGDKTTEHSGKDSTVDETKTSAYDSSTYQPENYNTTDLTHGEKIEEDASENTNTTTDGLSNKKTDSSSTVNKGVSETEKTTQKNHIRGNIGVTTAMAMEREEMDYIANYNPYTFLSGLFENELTLFVY